MNVGTHTNRFVWIPIVMAMVGGGLGVWGMFNDSIYEIRQRRTSARTAVYSVELFGFKIHEAEVARGRENGQRARQNRRARENTVDENSAEFLQRSWTWMTILTVALAMVFGFCGWLVAQACQRLVRPRSTE